MTMNLFGLLVLAVFASKKEQNDVESDPKYVERIWNNEENPIVVKIEEDEYVKVNKISKFIGVSYHKSKQKWCVQRRNKKSFCNGCYDDEKTAAHASDTLAKKLMKNYSELKLKLNFPDDDTEVYPEENKSSTFIGVSYFKKTSKWCVHRQTIYYGCYDDEITAANASDTLARKLMENGERELKLNFPDDHTEVYPEEKTSISKYIGLKYDKKTSKWCVRRWSSYERTRFSHGYYEDEETAAHASDTLARKLMKNGGQKLKLNFPNDETEVYPEEKIITSKYFGVIYHKKSSKWRVGRWSKQENKNVSFGCYDDEETAARASDILAKQMIKNGDRQPKLNFPDKNTQVRLEENQKKKRKRPKDLSLEHPQNN